MTRVGITLPSFREDVETPLAVAAAADAAGVDGVFLFDHLFRVGPDGRRRPAIEATALMGAVAVETRRAAVGTLVARATLRPPAVLASAFDTASRIAPGRVIAAVGSGDHESEVEMEAFGLPSGTVAERVAALAATVDACTGRGYPVWVGGASVAVREVAGARSDGWNRWGAAGPGRFAAEAEAVRRAAEAAGRDPAACTLSWGGLVVLGADDREAAAKATRLGAGPSVIVGGPERVAEELRRFAAAGAAWVIVGPVDAGDPDNATLLGEAVAPLL